MKYFYAFFTLLLITVVTKAKDQQPPVKNKQNIEALKVAFISKELVLSPTEAQQFWPLYNKYTRELKLTRSGNTDVLERDEKVLNLRKNYKEQFTKIIGPKRVNDLYNAEAKFHQLLFKAVRKQQKQAGRRQAE